MKLNAGGHEWIKEFLDPAVYFGKIKWHSGWVADSYDIALPFSQEGMANTTYTIVEDEIHDVILSPTVGVIAFVPQLCEGTKFFVVDQASFAEWLAYAQREIVTNGRATDGLSWVYELEEPELVEIV